MPQIISKEIKQTLLLAWPLFLGLSMIMVGNGLQGTLLGLRASIEGFPVFVTGLVMSLYYCGFLLGCVVIPPMIAKVGHIRVFAAFASVASTTILLHGVFVNPWIWGVVRVFSGLSFAGLFIISESWLNSISTNKLRGQIFGFYLLVIHGGLFGGQFLINMAPLDDIGLFILISILVSLSLLPLTLADKPAPGYAHPKKLPLKKLIKSSPFSTSSVFCAGFCNGSMFGIGSVYAIQAGYTNIAAAHFIAAYILGNAVMPLAIGWISDRLDRRKVIICLAGACALCSVAIILTNMPFLFIFLFGGVATSIYSVGIAYMNDNINPSYAVSASTSLILLNAFGATIGPILSGTLMNLLGHDAFFAGFASAMTVLFIFGLYRAFTGEEIIIDDQSEFIPVPSRASPGVIQITEDD